MALILLEIKSDPLLAIYATGKNPLLPYSMLVIYDMTSYVTHLDYLERSNQVH